MSKLLIQHGPAKGQKIIDSLGKENVSGVVFSINDEPFESIQKHINSSQLFTKNNCYLDPQFYLSTFDLSVQKKVSEIYCFPSDITRRNWRNRDKKILDYINYHATKTEEVSNTLITPGFYIDNIDWHFDYSIEIYNYCLENYKFDNYALSLLIQSSFFNNRKNVEEILVEMDELCDRKDYIYFTICYDNNSDNNYEEIDSACLGNILSFIYQLKMKGFKFIIGYSFMNSILFAMLDCEFIASGWFNTLRKFQKNRFEFIDIFGRRKKRYTSIPLLSYIMFDDINSMLVSDKLEKQDIISDTEFDEQFIYDENSLSFVDLEHQYWESLNNIFSLINEKENTLDRINYVQILINKSITYYRDVINALDSMDEQESLKRIKSASKHLISWQIAIDLFKENEMIL